jgi:DNA repair protein RecO (recombination protein O)
MPPVATDALVLHVFDYLETSRILCLITREAGVQRVLARGARRASVRFGTALDLFVEGVADLELRPGRELQTLRAFEVTRVHPGLADSGARFSAAAALSECVQRLVSEEQAPGAFEVVREAVTRLATVAEDEVVGTALAALWRLVSELGVAPELDACAVCDASVPSDVAAPFSHVSGGVLCARCGQGATGVRRLPPEARGALRTWLSGGMLAVGLGEAEGRAHQRLLREFLGQHLTDMRALRAFASWEAGRWR